MRSLAGTWIEIPIATGMLMKEILWRPAISTRSYSSSPVYSLWRLGKRPAILSFGRCPLRFSDSSVCQKDCPFLGESFTGGSTERGGGGGGEEGGREGYGIIYGCMSILKTRFSYSIATA